MFGPRDKNNLTIDEEIEILEAYQEEMGFLNDEDVDITFETDE